MSPARVYWTAFAMFGLAAAVDVGMDIAAGEYGVGTLAAAAGVVALGYASFVALRRPDRANVPSEWGPLVYLVVAGAGLYAAGLALRLYEMVA